MTAPLSIQAKNQFLDHFYVVISVLKEKFYINKIQEAFVYHNKKYLLSQEWEVSEKQTKNTF